MLADCLAPRGRAGRRAARRRRDADRRDRHHARHDLRRPDRHRRRLVRGGRGGGPARRRARSGGCRCTPSTPTLIKGRYGDIVNAVENRKAGSIIAAEFLSASSATCRGRTSTSPASPEDNGKPYAPKGGAGFGVRLLRRARARDSSPKPPMRHRTGALGLRSGSGRRRGTAERRDRRAGGGRASGRRLGGTRLRRRPAGRTIADVARDARGAGRASAHEAATTAAHSCDDSSARGRPRTTGASRSEPSTGARQPLARSSGATRCGGVAPTTRRAERTGSRTSPRADDCRACWRPTGAGHARPAQCAARRPQLRR